MLIMWSFHLVVDEAGDPPVVVDGVAGRELEDDGLLRVGLEDTRHVLELEHALITVDHKL